MASVRHQDPYEIPSHLIPSGMIYQWVSKNTFGGIDKQYQTMLDAGWTNVPYKRLERHFRGKYQGGPGYEDEIRIGGQVLMERIRDVSKIARDKEMDQAVVNANSGRDIAVDLAFRINLSAFEIETARSMSLSSSQYVAWRIRQIAEEKDPSIIMGCQGGQLMFSTMPKRFVAKYGWLKWLFNLISVETEETDYE